MTNIFQFLNPHPFLPTPQQPLDGQGQLQIVPRARETARLQAPQLPLNTIISVDKIIFDNRTSQASQVSESDGFLPYKVSPTRIHRQTTATIHHIMDKAAWKSSMLMVQWAGVEAVLHHNACMLRLVTMDRIIWRA
jgi:hypothetical protein